MFFDDLEVIDVGEGACRFLLEEENLLLDFGETMSRRFVVSSKVGLDSGAHGGCVFVVRLKVLLVFLIGCIMI